MHHWLTIKKAVIELRKRLNFLIFLGTITSRCEMVRAVGLEPTRAQGPTDFKSGMSTIPSRPQPWSGLVINPPDLRQVNVRPRKAISLSFEFAPGELVTESFA